MVGVFFWVSDPNFNMGQGVSPTTPSNFQAPVGCPSIQRDSDTVYLETA